MVTIDMRQCADDFRRMLTDAVQRYHAAPVTRIDLAFSLGDSESIPWVHLHLDTKPGSEPDGDPSHPDFGKLSRPDWLPAVQAVCEEETVDVIGLDGESHSCDEVELSTQIGEFLVSVLLNARAEGVFAALPRAERCELGVEDPTTGDFGWPNYEDRGQENLV
jgi:hypothetical protein